jgi:ribosomal protein S15P/S13E
MYSDREIKIIIDTMKNLSEYISKKKKEEYDKSIESIIQARR